MLQIFHASPNLCISLKGSLALSMRISIQIELIIKYSTMKISLSKDIKCSRNMIFIIQLHVGRMWIVN